MEGSATNSLASPCATRTGLVSAEAGDPQFYQFCPAVMSVALAQRFGVAHVLVSHGADGPTGSVFVQAVGDEDL